jgi:predicted naringenin-chalcone synthase
MRRYDERVGPVARRAAAAALKEAAADPASVTHLVTVSCTGFAAPGFDLGLVKGLRLDPSVQRTHVGFMGCHGALNGLRVARALAASEPGSRVLVCAAELCSLHFRYGGGAGESVTNALFADGAAAVVAAPATEAPPGSWRVVANGSVLVPGTEDAMTWRVGDHGFEMTLSPEVPDLIRRHLADWLGGWLARRGLQTGDVGSWAVHPGGPRVLDAVRDALGLPGAALDDSRAVLASYGNMSSPTVLFILDRLVRRVAPRPCVALGFGPGLAVEAALIG